MNDRTESAAAQDTPQDARAGRMEIAISNVLRCGVMVSVLLIVSGTVVTFARHGDYAHDPGELQRLTSPGTAFPRSIGQVLDGVRHGSGQAIVVAGLLLLIATPVMRVAVAVLAFARERDGVFALISSVVLLLLILSFVLGRVEG